ncbi:MAG: sulfatase-like hydrolase/transferase [Elusimicrobia bacterium]|nr:sulfatase-like hydrolase/transferase [Elusimicrobiota bacterium]
MISLDTLRADHLGCYGYNRNTTPNLDKLAKDGILFRQAVAQASYTLPSTISIFTGQHALTHGVPLKTMKLQPSVTTLAEVLQQHGYQTAAFTGSMHSASPLGLDQGFGTYNSGIEYERLVDVLPRVYDWINGRKNKNFFLFLHAYDCHAPYELPEKYKRLYETDYKGVLNQFGLGHGAGNNIKGHTLRAEDGKVYQLGQRDIDHWIAQYDGALSNMDRQIGDFLNYLEELKLMDNTIVIFLGNHGEALLDHGYIVKSRHGDIYEEGIHVPLIMKLPKWLSAARGKAIDVQAQLIDLMPTILDWLAIPVPGQVQGKSLAPLINDTAPKGFNEFAFSIGASGHWMPWRVCVRSLEWKLIQFCDGPDMGARYELYQLSVDPNERKNLINARPEIARPLKERLKQHEALADPDLLQGLKRFQTQQGMTGDRSPKGYRPNILMIALDAGRADHFSAYGYQRPTTPNTDDLARHGILFRAAYAQSDLALPSFASLLTGKYPGKPGLSGPGPAGAGLTLPEALKKEGYRTAFFSAGDLDGPEHVFSGEFDLYREPKAGTGEPAPTGQASAFLPEVFKWMEENKNSDAPFFVLLGPGGPSWPYLPPGTYLGPYAGNYEGLLNSLPLSTAVLRGIGKDGDGWYLSADGLSAEAAPLSGKSEGLGEHGAFLRPAAPPRPYQETTHVPLIIKTPKWWLNTENTVIDQPVELVDLMPTLLELVRSPGALSTGAQGQSLAGVIMGLKKERMDRPVFTGTSGAGVVSRSVQSGDWKLVRSGTEGGSTQEIELYDLAVDPGETLDLAPQKPRIAKELLDLLNARAADN